jgi:hypothetical protein
MIPTKVVRLIEGNNFCVGHKGPKGILRALRSLKK